MSSAAKSATILNDGAKLVCRPAVEVGRHHAGEGVRVWAVLIRIDTGSRLPGKFNTPAAVSLSGIINWLEI